MQHHVVISRVESKASDMHLAVFPGEKPKLLSHNFDEGSYLSRNFKQEHKTRNILEHSSTMKISSSHIKIKDGKLSCCKRVEVLGRWGKLIQEKIALCPGNNVVPREDGVGLPDHWGIGLPET